MLPDYRSDEGYRALQGALLKNPELGDLMPGTEGFRKVRWKDARRGKGERSGLGVIYDYLMADRQIRPFVLYDKDQAADLTHDETGLLRQAIQVELQA